MAKSNFYTVWVGHTPGVYSTWKETSDNVNGFRHAKFKGFKTKPEAEKAFSEPWENHIGQNPPNEVVNQVSDQIPPAPDLAQARDQVLDRGHELVYTDGVDQYGLYEGEKPF